MKTKKTITVCFKDNTNIQEKTNSFKTNNIRLNDSLNFEPLFNIEEKDTDNGDLMFSTYNEMSNEEKKLYRIYKVEVDIENLDKVKAQLENNSDIEFVEVNELFETKYTPNDPAFPQLYGLKKIACEKVWPTTQGEDIIVAVIDTGVDYNHPDINANMWNNNGAFGYDFSENNSDPMDINGHGTHVAGTIGAVANNNAGIVGVSPEVKIMALKIFPNALPHVISKALRFAVDNGAKILNNSWGPTNRRPSSPTIEAAIDYVYSKGGICVFAAGNEGDDTKYYSPANYSKTIAVGATDSNDLKPSFSNFGNDVDIYAPGKNILSLEKGTPNYNYKSGTSMAAPHVSGGLALHISKNPSKTFNEIVQDLKTKSDTVNNMIRLNCNKLTK